MSRPLLAKHTPPKPEHSMFGPYPRAIALCVLVAMAAACGDDAEVNGLPDQLTFPAWSFDAGVQDGGLRTGSSAMRSMLSAIDPDLDPLQGPRDPSVPASERSQGVGVSCDDDGDCQAGLHCREDSVDFIAHRQCTADCSIDQACEPRFGELTFCINAGFCVAACLLDTDCPAGSRCGRANWCERDGEASGNPFCSGVPTSCSLLTGSGCFGQLGCSDASECRGVSASCFSQLDSFSCASQDGCFWNSGDNSCSGVSRSCSSYSGEFTCGSQAGCRWDARCTGVPLVSDCSGESASLCEFTDGCSLQLP